LKKLLSIFLLCAAQLVNGQLIEVPIGPTLNSPSKQNSIGGRIQSGGPLVLPFWDDFSFTQEKDFPNDTLWSTRKSVWVNNGIGINPPSIFTATFDGIDSTGKPHNITEILAKGFADRLISRPIDLSTLPPTQNDSVYLSFFYQVKGRGEAPDLDDNFSLWFRDINGTWEKVFEVGNSLALDPSEFYYQNIKVESKFFHDKFQFKFQNFARLSGPYDTWNLDYIYLNKRRKATDIYFHDQSLTKPLTSIFKNYRAIPIKHFKDTASSVLILPKGGFYNLYRFDAQSFKYSTWATVFQKAGDTETSQTLVLQEEGDPQTVLPRFTHLELELAETVPLNALNLSADSIHINFKLGFDSGDKNIVPETPLFHPIDFTLNDTVYSEFILHKHYAYDDGTAEYGAGLNQPGAEMAYKFNMYTKEVDTVVAVDLYFPQFGDNSSQTLILKFWNSTLDQPATEIYSETISVQRTISNRFTRYTLAEPVGVRRNFFVGWEHTGTVAVPVGLDKNTDSGDKIFSNITGSWEQNQTVSGSLMIRPVFGKGKAANVVTGIVERVLPEAYPNPSNGQFNIPLHANSVAIVNMMGSSVEFECTKEPDNQVVKITNPNPGIYILRYRLDNTLLSTKVWVRN
jgi:hypothetical protein